jgi:hypothetical protein
MSRRVKIAIAGMVVAVVIGAFYFPKLRQRVLRLARLERTEEQARREVVQPPIATPTDVKVKAKIFWASTDAPGALEAVDVELPLSADPVLRSQQLIHALIADPPSLEQRTLPPDATLIVFYLLPDGTAVADFSDALSTETPSGILSEQIAVDSLARTLAANADAVRRLKILIHGQETETLAGHLDLTDFFVVRAEAPKPPAPAAPAAPGGKAPAPAGGLTPPGAPGKLGP